MVDTIGHHWTPLVGNDSAIQSFCLLGVPFASLRFKNPDDNKGTIKPQRRDERREDNRNGKFPSAPFASLRLLSVLPPFLPAHLRSGSGEIRSQPNLSELQKFLRPFVNCPDALRRSVTDCRQR